MKIMHLEVLVTPEGTIQCGNDIIGFVSGEKGQYLRECENVVQTQAELDEPYCISCEG